MACLKGLLVALKTCRCCEVDANWGKRNNDLEPVAGLQANITEKKESGCAAGVYER